MEVLAKKYTLLIILRLYTTIVYYYYYDCNPIVDSIKYD